MKYLTKACYEGFPKGKKDKGIADCCLMQGNTEADSSQRCSTKGQESTVLNFIKGNFKVVFTYRKSPLK